MATSHDRGSVEFGGPATYRIEIEGPLTETSRRRFVGMTFESTSGDGDTPRTILHCDVRDQAELRGVLEAIYGLHLSVILVERCNDD